MWNFGAFGFVMGLMAVHVELEILGGLWWFSFTLMVV
jgi:hypothetical protein